MIHPDSELRYVSDEMGYGVFAAAFIPRGTLIWVLDAFDRVLTQAEVDALAPPLRPIVARYAYVTPEGTSVLCWDFGRYMNHSCQPASRGIGEGLEVAVRDLYPGDEMTCEYGTLNLVEPLECRCGAPGCRGVIRHDDPDRYHSLWDREAAAAWALAPTVPQPLLAYARVSEADRVLVEGLARGVTHPPPSASSYTLRRGTEP